MKITNLMATESRDVGMTGSRGVTKKVPLGKSDGAPNFSFRVFTIEPGGHTPRHLHDQEHLNYIIEGEGVVVTADEQKKPVKKGDFALIMPNEMHQYINTSDTSPMVMICAVPRDYE